MLAVFHQKFAKLSEEFHKVKNLSSKGIEIGDVKLNL